MRKILSILLCAALLIGCACTVSAASTADAVEILDTGKACSLELKYVYDGVALDGQDVSLYKVADVDKDLVYTLDETFKDLGVTFTDVKAQAEYDKLNITASGLVLAGKVAANFTAKTDAKGVARFENIPQGMYMVSNLSVVKGEKFYTVESFLVAVPNVGADGKLQYDVVAEPKAVTGKEPTKGLRTYEIIASFADEGNEDKRPESVEVTIVREGKEPEKVTLSKENGWKYEWTEVDDGTQISVIQEKVPEGYSYAVSRLGDVFTVVNTYIVIPPLGDTLPIGLLIAVMAVSGAALIALGIFGKKRNKA